MRAVPRGSVARRAMSSSPRRCSGSRSRSSCAASETHSSASSARPRRSGGLQGRWGGLTGSAAVVASMGSTLCRGRSASRQGFPGVVRGPGLWGTRPLGRRLLSMLLGREGERAQLEDLLSGARAGISSALVLVGEAGVGKSALLHFAREQAGDGFTTVFAQGVESESDIAFSALSALLRPLLGHLDALPQPQAAALASALAIGPPVAGDRFTVSAATLSLLAAAAEEKPLLVLVDDAQWIDRASAEALLFAARRLVAEGVLVLFTQREDVGELDTTGVPVLRLGGLDADAARELLQERVGSRVAPEVAARLVDATGGNALALAELPALLAPAQLAGTEALDEPLPVGAALEGALGAKIRELP